MWYTDKRDVEGTCNRRMLRFWVQIQNRKANSKHFVSINLILCKMS